LARAAFDALVLQVDEPINPNIQREFLVSTSLVVRESTAAVRSSSRKDFKADLSDRGQSRFASLKQHSPKRARW
jgi:hypothetical protein